MTERAAVRRMKRHLAALALPLAAAAAPGALAARGDVIVRQDGGQLLFSERGGPFRPVPDGPAAAALRDLAASGQSLAVDVGPTVVADGASGWHRDNADKRDGKP